MAAADVRLALIVDSTREPGKTIKRQNKNTITYAIEEDVSPESKQAKDGTLKRRGGCFDSSVRSEGVCWRQL